MTTDNTPLTPAEVDAMRAALDAHLDEAPQHAAPEIPEGRHMAPTAPLSPSEFLMSLNGFDEIAIAARFGTTLGALRREDEITVGRALAFVHFRRCGQNDVDAHKTALTLTLREVVEFFAPEPTPEDAEGNAASAT